MLNFILKSLPALIPNWRAVLWRSHSMRALILGVIWTGLVSIIAMLPWLPIPPMLVAWVYLGLLAYGAVGRLLAQGIGDE
ncbi:hypothetical protein BV509_18195 [Rhodovulum sulfidophilum]|uniref:Uncharacterized protein n=2 Tax=Rhodovulum TaxID=34008 RepID=A0ABS1RL42_9RHOB|nr:MULTISPECIES: hypothetical protein [Rhodovulum]MBL3571240.1 hypothetical protein [Rhodovulum visakhapatnamense]MBL3580235.1 hypothetical protein [Rhodovulum visakhapatnamense]OLS46090.1 hypothetical protein BV509_18195 [Rhodovulum sulfidophilum]PTW43887.1 hypothetical protein C8N38_12027 [Rhodovulum kholense]